MRVLTCGLLMCLAAALPAQGQSAPASDDDTGVTVNLDALGLPEPAPIPEIPPEDATPRKARVSSREGALRVVPLPRPKPSTSLAAAPATEPASEPAPVPREAEAVGRPKPKADLPSTMLGNFPVELRGTARDPFPNARSVDPAAGFKLIGRIRFASGDSAPSTDAVAAIDALIEDLAALTSRIRIVAYSGRPGDLSSQARRLSLERARAVRDQLVARGIASERIDVMPFGGPSTGETDRIDVLVPPG